MKNSKNDNFTLIGNDSPFGNLPTAAEAERMEAAAPEGDAFAEDAVANLALLPPASPYSCWERWLP